MQNGSLKDKKDIGGQVSAKAPVKDGYRRAWTAGAVVGWGWSGDVLDALEGY